MSSSSAPSRPAMEKQGKPFRPPPSVNTSRVITDSRFSHVHTDPRFQRAPHSSQSVRIDARFKRMFHDPAFKTDYVVDKWGRQVKSKGADELKKFYDIHDDDDDDDEDGKEGEVEGNAEATAAASATAPSVKQQKLRREEQREEEEEEEKEEAEGREQAKGKRKAKEGSHRPATKTAKRTAKLPPHTTAPALADNDEGEDDGEGEGDDAAGDDYTRAYLSERAVAPPSSDSDASSPSSPTFPNFLGSDSDSDLSPTPFHEDDDDDQPPPSPIPLTDDPPTCRLAVVNLDWDKLRALDIFTLCRSFQAGGGGGEGRVEDVSVYRSEFGKERMKEEDRYGPIGLYGGSAEEYRQRIEQLASTQAQAEKEAEKADGEAAAAEDDEQADDDDEEEGEHQAAETSTETKETADDDDEEASPEEGDEHAEEDGEGEEEGEAAGNTAAADNAVDPSEPTALDQEKLRTYELSRLRYFYAVIRCSSPTFASHLYRELDGTELESTANKLDLRFIPDTTAFDVADLRDRVHHTAVDAAVLGAYRPPAFATKALQHSRVELSWDGEEEGRKKLRKGKWKGDEEEEDDLKVYLASEGEEDAYGSDAATEVSDDEQEERVVLKRKARARYSNLLASLNGKGKQEGEEGEDGGGKEGEEQVFEMTFEPGLKAKGEELVKRVQEKEEQRGETVFERRARLVREKKRERKKTAKAKAKGEGGEGADDDDEEEEDVVSVDEDDDFFKGAFDDDDYRPAQGVRERAKAFFADDERKERVDKRANRMRREAGRGEEEGEMEAKRKERAELELLLMPDHPVADEQQDRGYNLKRLLQSNQPAKKGGKKARKAAKEGEEAEEGAVVDDFQVDTGDARFAAMYERAEFSIDPTHPGYRPTKEMERVMAETGKRRREQRGRTEQEVRERKQSQRRAEEEAKQSGQTQADDAGLDVLVRSVKAKAKAREAQEEQRKKADASRAQSGAGKRLGEESLSKLNKRQRLKGEPRL